MRSSECRRKKLHLRKALRNVFRICCAPNQGRRSGGSLRRKSEGCRSGGVAGVLGMGRAGRISEQAEAGPTGWEAAITRSRKKARQGAKRKRSLARMMWRRAKKSRVAERGRSVRRGDAAGKISRSADEAFDVLAESDRFVIGPGWNARSCRGGRKVRAGDRIPRRKRVRAIRWRRCRRALPRPGVRTSCPWPRRASA